jgi:hypothetical protein
MPSSKLTWFKDFLSLKIDYCYLNTDDNGQAFPGKIDKNPLKED